MGKVQEQFVGVLSAANTTVDFGEMWVGPRDAREIENTINGNPSMVPCPVGINLNDGRGVQGFRERKGFMTVQEMHRWIEDQEPDKQSFPCPYCVDEDGNFGFVGDSANALATHMQTAHKPETIISTPDFDGAKRDKIANEIAAAQKRDDEEAAMRKKSKARGRPKKAG